MVILQPQFLIFSQLILPIRSEFSSYLSLSLTVISFQLLTFSLLITVRRFILYFSVSGGRDSFILLDQIRLISYEHSTLKFYFKTLQKIILYLFLDICDYIINISLPLHWSPRARTMSVHCHISNTQQSAQDIFKYLIKKIRAKLFTYTIVVQLK